MFVKKHGSQTTLDANDAELLNWGDIGDLQVSGLEANGELVVPVMNRGRFEGWVESDDSPIEVSFTFRINRETFSHASNPRPLDLIFGTGSFAGATSDNPIASGPKAYRHVITYEKGAVTAEIKLLKARYRLTSFAESGETLIGSVSVTAYGFEIT